MKTISSTFTCTLVEENEGALRLEEVGDDGRRSRGQLRGRAHAGTCRGRGGHGGRAVLAVEHRWQQPAKLSRTTATDDAHHAETLYQLKQWRGKEACWSPLQGMTQMNDDYLWTP